MTPSSWIALAALCLTVLGAAVYLGRLIGSLPGMIAAAVRAHEDGCAAWERAEHSTPRLQPVALAPRGQP